jgi:trimeric autotransporter adhesin
MRSPQSAAAAAVLFALAVAGCSNNDDNDAPAPAPMQPTPAPAPTPGDTFGLTNAGRLVTFNRTAPSVRTAVVITGMQTGEQLLGIDIRPGGTPAGELYALGSTGRIYTINTTSGAVTQKSQLAADSTDTTNPFTALDGTAFGVDFNPVVDRLRVVSNTGQNLRINVDTGATFTDDPLNSGGATRTGVSATAYTNSFAAACRTTLFYIDTDTDSLLTTADPNAGTLTELGSLGVDADASSGYEIITAADGTNSAIAVLTVGGAATLYSINQPTAVTPAATAIGAVTGLNSRETLLGISAASTTTAPAQAVGSVLAVTETNKLISFNNATPQKLCTSAVIAGLQNGENVLGIDTRPADGALYAVGSTGRIYTIDTTTAAATLKSTLVANPADTTDPFTALDGTEFGVDFNPVPDLLRVVSNTRQNLRIVVDTGATTTDMKLNPGAAGATAAAYTNSFAGAGTTTLYVFDVANDRLMIQGQPSGSPNNGDLQPVGPLGIDLQAATGFDINGVNNAAFAAVTLAAATTSELHTINLTSGAATRVNAIGGGERVRSLTLNANPRATLLGVTTDNRLITFKTTTPGTLDANVAVTGLQGGETIIGIDMRPANGRLYAVTDSARLYTLDATTGAATMAGMLTADAADATTPFAMLSGAAFGVDFNPMADRLRVVSDAEQNLRAIVDSGATTTDATLARGAFAVTAAAYTNNFATPPSTTLYVIDTQNDRLLTQNPPNNGTLNDVGALGIDAAAVNGFEIVGPDTALAVLSTSSAPSALYTISLATGAALLVGNVTTPQASDSITGISAMPTAATPAPDSIVYAVLNGVTLTSFARNAPTQLAAPIAITGLQSAETLIGIDFRPADSLLYAVGSTGRLYTIDVTSGAATQVAVLAADAADPSDPFTALNGMNFGFDFNPLADRLRIVSDARQNLRIVPATGAVTTDGTLNFVAPDVVAAAYTQSFAPRPASTRLLALDAATGTLQMQDPPNEGVLRTLGRLDPALAFGPTAGFDIAGGDDGLSLAVLQPTGAAQSTLYRVNPKTGAATAVGAIGPAGTAPLRGFTIRLQ